MTHEIFLTAVVDSDEDAVKARAILCGYTEMKERQRFTKVRHMLRDGNDNGVKGFPTIKELQKERTANSAIWQELHQIFMKQSYIVQERTDVTNEAKNAVRS